MKIVLLCAQTGIDPWLEAVEKIYISKLVHFADFSIHRLKSKKIDRENKEIRLRSDSELIMSFLTKDDFVVLFDERGKCPTSEIFANDLQKILNSGKKRIVYIIGGPYGVDENVKNRAQAKISLSNLVFNHQIAESVILEQIYRAFTILKNLPYHNK